MDNWYDDLYQQHFDVPLSVIDEKIAKLCKEWGFVTKPEYMPGMRELFLRDGSLKEKYARENLEFAKKMHIIGDSAREMSWSGHLGD